MAVIGAGVVGLTTAHFLRLQGAEVTVFDRADAAATGTSFANGGQLSYSFTDALADPALLKKLPAMLVGADPGIRLRPTLRPRGLMWLAQFARNCTTGRSRVKSHELLTLALRSQTLMAEFVAQFGSSFDAQRAGKLVLLDNPASKATRQRVAARAGAGCDQRVLSQAEAIAVEPALAEWTLPFAAALYAPDDEVGDALRFCRTLTGRLENTGVRFQFGTCVTGLTYQADQVRIASTLASTGKRATTPGVATTEQDAATDCFDRVVVCSAQANEQLLSGGSRVLIEPLTGYSLTLPAGPHAPTTSITVQSHKIVYCQLGTRLRVAGYADFNAHPKRYGARQQALLESAQEIAPAAGCWDQAGVAMWTGHRPMTPDSLPQVRATTTPGVFVNTGHGMLGWTLCAATGEQAAQLVLAS